MPIVAFDQLPSDARVWVFASDRPLRGDDAAALLSAVDHFLEQWKAHGAPLRSARDWRDDRFLVIGVDPSAEQASGCSIDGLFRNLQALERELDTRLVAGGRVFYRGSDAEPKLAARADVPRLVARGELTESTPVYDTSITDAARLRRDFVRPARDTWVASLLRA
ncbi:MAG TPA: hypothetical protein VFT29_06855 [Gemmatimonadaceae bacterium]|nr:hypothetical protein [Gemmatimonadaceae bacterium]